MLVMHISAGALYLLLVGYYPAKGRGRVFSMKAMGRTFAESTQFQNVSVLIEMS